MRMTGGTRRGGSMYMNSHKRMQTIMQNNEEAIADIRNDLIKIKDILTKLTAKHTIIQQKQAEKLAVTKTQANTSTSGHKRNTDQLTSNKR
ncbi:hypothetical protein RclHR1_08560004 [Rhizophagus clarus]|uniref:Uncharacterized protein n=1 Tax=Rhizophagus clarus TaxID=94130 RepID=A0A2Z6S0Y1_9GLOM|nr:hypothetical protein RclHR1_08560004 [Rhizophagus clarus]GES85472.1 hypothetical protein RCL_jg6488.t1 [Rhizophagus clarus]